MLRAVDLTHRYGDVVALDGLTLDIGAGEVVSLLGANGAGKTTTLNLLLGFLRPTSGRAEVSGVDVSARPEEARKHLGFLPEVVSLYPTLSGVETLEYFSELSGRRKPTDSHALLNSVGLPEDVHLRRVSTYSKGMRQKLGLSLALAKGARALLLDEPLSGLDPVAANELVRLLSLLAAGGTSVLMVTHDIFRAQQLGGRIGIMRRGKLVKMMRAADVSANEIEQLYVSHIRDVA
jgi:ABC-2 type transport system ATP-binding protein